MAPRRRVPRPERAAVQQYAEHRRGRSSRSKPFDERNGRTAERDQRRAQAASSSADPGRLRLRGDAAAGPGPGQSARLPDVRRGSRRPGLRRSCRRAVADCRARSRRRRAWPSVHPATRPTCRSSMPTWIASRPRRRASPLTELFDTLQIYLGSALRQRLQPVRPHLAGDRAGRRPVSATASRTSRSCRPATTAGEMVPIGFDGEHQGQTFGPDPVLRYNGYPAADLTGEADAAPAARRRRRCTLPKLAQQVLPGRHDLEWTDLSYQQVHARSTAPASCSRSACCWRSWCWRRCTRAGRCRWR